MTFTYVVTYFLVALTCSVVATVILNQLTSDMGTELEVRSFRSYVAWYLVFALTNAVWVWINYGFLHLPGTIFSVVNLVAICMASYYWFSYVELRLDSDRVMGAAFRVVSLIPLVVAILLVVTTPLTHLVFHYEGESYIHGPLYSTMAILAILYLVAASIDLGLHFSQVQSPSQRRQYATLIWFLLFPVVGGVVDIFIPNLPVMELMLLIGTSLVYTNMQHSRIYSDALTGLNNRRLADEYLLNRIAIASEENPLYLFMCDANLFKNVNDKYGHSEGDRALCTIAQALREAADPTHCHISRWGGDEFVLIGDATSIPVPEELMDSIQTRLSEIAQERELPYGLSLSMGYATCTNPKAKASDLMKQADKAMYEAKHRAHAELAS